MQVSRDEWLRVMLELAALDRAKYREVREHAWKRIAEAHERKTPAQISAWKSRAS